MHASLSAFLRPIQLRDHKFSIGLSSGQALVTTALQFAGFSESSQRSLNVSHGSGITNLDPQRINPLRYRFIFNCF